MNIGPTFPGLFCQLCHQAPCVCSGTPVDWGKPGPLQWVPHVHTPSQRERIATAAMQAIATSTVNGWVSGEGDAQEIAKRALFLADALIAGLNSPSNPKGNV